MLPEACAVVPLSAFIPDWGSILLLVIRKSSQQFKAQCINIPHLSAKAGNI
jgi:hypothetical protein